MVRSFRPEIDLGRMAREMTGISLGRYALVLAALGLGLNVTLSIVPLFREMLERASVLAANGFNEMFHYHAGLEKSGKTEDSKKIKEFVDGYVGPDGQWVPFGMSQTAVLYIVTLVLAGNGLGQSLGKLVHAGLSPDAERLQQLGTVLTWMMLLANGMFLWALLQRRLLGRRGPAGAATEQTVATFWRAARDPELVVVCRPDRGEVRVEPVEEARSAEPIDETRRALVETIAKRPGFRPAP